METYLKLLYPIAAIGFSSTVSAEETNWAAVKQSNPDLYICASIIPSLGVPEHYPDQTIIASCSKLIAIVEQKHRENDQRSANFYFGRAKAYANIKDWHNASLDLDKALRLFPQDDEFLQLKKAISSQSNKPESTAPSVVSAATGDLPALSEINKNLENIDLLDQHDPHTMGMRTGALLRRGEVYVSEGYYRYALEDLTWAQQALQKYGDGSTDAQNMLTRAANGIREAREKLSQDRKSYNIQTSDFVTFMCEPVGDRISVDKRNLVVLDNIPLMGSRCISAFREDVDGKPIFNEDQCKVPFSDIVQNTMPVHATVSVHGNVVYWGVEVAGPFALKAAAAGPLRESIDMITGVHTGTESKRQCHVLARGE